MSELIEDLYILDLIYKILKFQDVGKVSCIQVITSLYYTKMGTEDFEL